MDTAARRFFYCQTTHWEERMDRLLTVPEAARLLGVSTSFLYHHTAAGKIKHYRVGRALRFDESQLAEWLRKREVSLVETGQDIPLAS
jgi:excisionase family DNA binding protein